MSTLCAAEKIFLLLLFDRWHRYLVCFLSILPATPRDAGGQSPHKDTSIDLDRSLGRSVEHRTTSHSEKLNFGPSPPADAFEWVASLLQSHLESLGASEKNGDPESGSSSNLNVHIDVYVTRRGTGQSTSSEYAPSSSSPSRPESLSEKPSVHSSGTLTPAVSDEDIVPELGRMPAKVFSNSEIDEKGAFRKTSSSLGRFEDLWSRHGVRVQIHQGRPDIEQELKTMKQTTREYAVGAPSLGIAGELVLIACRFLVETVMLTSSHWRPHSLRPFFSAIVSQACSKKAAGHRIWQDFSGGCIGCTCGAEDRI